MMTRGASIPLEKRPHGLRATLTSAGRVFSAEALLLPTGMVTAIYLTRHLGPADYGLFSLAATLTSWMAWLVGALYGRATVKLISESIDPVPERSPAVAIMLRAYALTGGAATLALLLGASPLARLFGEEALAPYLRLLAFEIVLFAVAMAHKEILVGLRRFRERAVCAAVRWTARMLLMITLVQAGLSVRGAAIGSVLATAMELAVARYYVRPSFAWTGDPSHGVWRIAAPLMGYSICIKLFQRIDLFAVKALGGSAADAGFYGAAHNLSLPLSLVTLSLAPLLLANLVRLRLTGDRDTASRLCVGSMRFAVGILPFVAAAAGASGRLVPLLFGTRFLPTAEIFAILVFAEIAMVIGAIASSMIVAKDRSRIVLAVGACMIVAALAGHLAAIPRFGAVGAASVTTVVAIAGAIAHVVFACALWQVRFPYGTLARAVLLAVVAAAVAAMPVGSGLWVIPQLALVAVAIVAGFLLAGELGDEEKAKALEILRPRDMARKPV
jgi:O-antigen/teichoic acid export membrane protein